MHKLNANFTIDNKQYLAGVQEIPANHLAIMKTLDVKGVELITKEQTPLISEVTPVKDEKAKV